MRVTFFECERPQTLSSPEPSDITEALDAPFVMSQTESPAYQRQASTDSGWDNPFRPDGDLSREADEIVELIKGGKPITPTGHPNGEAVKAVENGNLVAEKAESVSKPPPPAANGKPATNGATEKPAQVELKRETVAPTDASQVEHVNLKKKPKCKCCVIQ